MKRLIVPIASGLLAGCATYAAENLGDGTARLGQSVLVDGYRVTPMKVLEDSRCPSGTTCVWAGRVRVLVREKHGTEVQDKTLTLPDTAPSHGKPVLVWVGPERRADKAIAPSDYRFRFQPGPID